MLRTSKRGFTLIEMLCVTAIIGILASMLLGAVSRAFLRAKRFEWEHKSTVLINEFRDKMRQHFGSAPQYPALSVDQMYEGGLINSTLRDFLKDKKVQFFPFSSETPENTLILHVQVSRNNAYEVFKREIFSEDL